VVFQSRDACDPATLPSFCVRTDRRRRWYGRVHLDRKQLARYPHRPVGQPHRRVWLAAHGGCETLQKWPDQWAGRALAHAGQSPASGKWWKNGSKPTASRTAERIAAAVSRGRTAHAPQRSHAASSSWRPAGA